MAFFDSIVVGVYGIPGVGKSRALQVIAKDRIEWQFADGSQLIEEVLNENGQTMEHFKVKMTPAEKAAVRRVAIQKVRNNPGVTVIAGHCSFPIPKEDGSEGVNFEDIFTSADGATYDAIIYLNRSPEFVFDQRKKDSQRSRQDFSPNILREWIDHEIAALRSQSAKHDFKLGVLSYGDMDDCRNLTTCIVETVISPAAHAAKLKSEQALRAEIEAEIPKSDVYLLIDGDRTICPQDTGKIFFDQVKAIESEDPLKQIFQRYDDYTFQAFWEVAMLYNKSLPKDAYLRLSESIGKNSLHVHQAWENFLSELPSNVHPILVSCSNREVWRAMLSQPILTENDGCLNGFSRMSVIAGNNISLHPYLVNGHAKAILARALRERNGGCHILSFGDSGKLSLMFRIVTMH
jgi:adenylate kinase